MSEEQAWALCFQSANTAISKREASFENLKRGRHIDIRLSTTEVRKDGTVEFVKITECSSPQKESDLLHSLGRLIYECLDFGVEVFMERELDPTLENLILDMACEQLGDEGISVLTSDYGEEPLSPRTRNFNKKDQKVSSNEGGIDMTLEEVTKRCLEHLPSDTSDPDGHYRAVCRALVSESLELSAFLQQLYNGHALSCHTRGQCFGSTNWAYLQSLRAAEWAQLWLQVMTQLRQGVTLRHVVYAKLPPSSYELTPYEMLMDDIRYKRYNLRNRVGLNSAEIHEKKADAHDMILEFIRSRPPLSKSSLRKTKPRQVSTPSPHDRLLIDIRSKPKLRSCPMPNVKSARELFLEEMIGSSSNGFSETRAKRKCLKPANKLAELISHWDSPVPTDQSMDELEISPFASRSSTPRPKQSGPSDRNHDEMLADEVQKWNLSDLSLSSLELEDGDSCIKNSYFTSTSRCEADARPIFPPSLRAMESMDITSKIYMTLDEVKHMRSTLAKLDLESLDPEERTYKELANGKLCFCCRKRKFSLLGNWSRICEICECRVCYYCIHKVDSSSSYLFQEDADYNQRDSGIGDMWSFTSYLSLSVSNIESKTLKICVACRRFINMHC